jgi:O-antigen ligase
MPKILGDYLLLEWEQLGFYKLTTIILIPVIVAGFVSLSSLQLALIIATSIFAIYIIRFSRLLLFQIFIILVTSILQMIGLNMIYYVIITNLFFAGFLLSFFIKRCLCKFPINEFPQTDKNKIILLLTIISLLSLISLFYNSAYNTDSVLEVIRSFSLIFLFLIIYEYMTNMHLVIKLLNTILFVSTLAAIYSIYLMITQGLKAIVIGEISMLHGVMSGLGNANDMAITVGFSLPILFAYLFHKKEQIKKKYTLSLAMLLFIVCVLLNSRATYIYIFIALLVIIISHKKRRFYLTLGLLAAIPVTAIILLSPIFNQLLRLEMGLSLRDHLWKAAIRIFLENPIWGSGPISFNTIKYYYVDPGPAKTIAAHIFGGEAHNLILTKAADYGIFMVLVFILFWIYVISFFIKNVNIMRNSQYYYIFVAAGASFMGLIAKSAFEIGHMIGNARLNENLVPFIYLAVLIKLPLLVRDKESAFKR